MPIITFDDLVTSGAAQSHVPRSNFRTRKPDKGPMGAKVVFGGRALDTVSNPRREARQEEIFQNATRDRISKRKEVDFLKKCCSDIGALFNADVIQRYHAHPQVAERNYLPADFTGKERKGLYVKRPSFVKKVPSFERKPWETRPDELVFLKKVREEILERVQTAWEETPAGSRFDISSIELSTKTKSESELNSMEQLQVKPVEIEQEPNWLMDTLSMIRVNTLESVILPHVEDEEERYYLEQGVKQSKLDLQLSSGPTGIWSEPILSDCNSTSELGSFDNILSKLKSSKTDPNLLSQGSGYDRKQVDMSMWLVRKIHFPGRSQFPRRLEKYSIPSILDTRNQQVLPSYWGKLGNIGDLSVTIADKLDVVDRWREVRNMEYMGLMDNTLDAIKKEMVSKSGWRRTRGLATCIRLAYQTMGEFSPDKRRLQGRLREKHSGFKKMLEDTTEEMLHDQQAVNRLGFSMLLSCMGMSNEKSRKVMFQAATDRMYDVDAWTACFSLIGEKLVDAAVIRTTLSHWAAARNPMDLRRSLCAMKQVTVAVPGVVNAMCTRLSSSDWETRLRVCKTLEIINVPLSKLVASELMRVMQGDLSSEVRWAAASALRATGNAHLVHNICVRFLSQPEPAGPLEGMHIMESLGSEKVTGAMLAAFVDCMNSKNMVIRMEALKLARKMRLCDDQVVETLQSVIETDPSVNVRESAILAIGNMGVRTIPIEDQLVAAIRYDRSSRIRMAAANSILDLQAFTPTIYRAVKACCCVEDNPEVCELLQRIVSMEDKEIDEPLFEPTKKTSGMTLLFKRNEETSNKPQTPQSPLGKEPYTLSEELLRSHLKGRVANQRSSVPRVSSMKVASEEIPARK